MVRTLLIAALVLLAGGCNHPSEEDCRKAIANIQRIAGTERSELGAEVEATVRSCEGSGTKESVACMIRAKTRADLRACEGGVATKMFGKDPGTHEVADAATKGSEPAAPGTETEATAPATETEATAPATETEATAPATETQAPETETTAPAAAKPAPEPAPTAAKPTPETTTR